MALKLLFGPDTSDHPNWGCRLMGAWFKAALTRSGASPAWVLPSAWFVRPHPALSEMRTPADFRRHAAEVEGGLILQDVADMLRRCDGVVLNGENFLRPGMVRGRMLLFLAYLAKVVFGKPCALINHSADLGEEALAGLAREVYPLLDEVHFREETTAEACAAWVRPGSWRLVPDVAFATPAAPRSEWVALGAREGHFSAWPDSAEGFDPAAPYVTVCASSAYALPQYEHRDFAPAFLRLCRRLNEEVGPVLLTAPSVVDARIMRQVQAETGLPLLGLNLPVRQGIDVLGNAAVHVGGRWHLGIFAATGGTPTVALSANNHKVHSLMRLLRMEGPVFDALEVEAETEAIVARAKACVEAGPALRGRLQERSRELGAQVGLDLDWVHAGAGR